MRGGKTIRRLLTAACLVFLHATQTNAQMAAPGFLDTPVPETWRAPFARFLHDMGVTDTASMVEASKTGLFPEMSAPEKMVFRVQHKDYCSPDLDECFTIIAHTENDELVADAMFSAGGKVNAGDVMRPFMGRRSVPIFFHGKRQVVVVYVTAKGFLIGNDPTPEPK